MRRRSARPLVLLAASALALGAAAACGDDGGGSGGDASSYADVAALDAALDESGRDCALEYEGLVDEEGTETSQCTIESQPAILRVYEDTSVLDAFVAPEGGAAPEAVTHGANWSIEVVDPALAAALAEDLGGTSSGESP